MTRYNTQMLRYINVIILDQMFHQRRKEHSRIQTENFTTTPESIQALVAAGNIALITKCKELLQNEEMNRQVQLGSKLLISV